MRHPTVRHRRSAERRRAKREARLYYELRRQKREREAPPPTSEKQPATNGKVFKFFVIALALAALVALARLVL